MNYTSASKEVDDGYTSETYSQITPQITSQSKSSPYTMNVNIGKPDKEIAEIVIDAMQSFLGRYYSRSSVDLSDLSCRPLTYQTCMRAFTICNQFSEAIRINTQDVKNSFLWREVSRSERNSFDDKQSYISLQTRKLEISKFAFEALKRYSETLRLGEMEIEKKEPDNFTVIDLVPLEEESLKYTTHSELGPLVKKSLSNESCTDCCTLF